MSISRKLVYRVTWGMFALTRDQDIVCDYEIHGDTSDGASDYFDTFNEALEFADLAAKCSPCVFENGRVVRRKFYINAYWIAGDYIEPCKLDGGVACPTTDDVYPLDTIDYNPEILDDFIDYYRSPHSPSISTNASRTWSDSK